MDLLINNAGVMYAPYLWDLLQPTPASRVVTVSSAGHRMGGPIDFDDLDWHERPYNRTAAYGHSKLANLLFTYELQRRLPDGGPLAVAAHPGGADTTGSKAAMSHSSWLTRTAFAAVRPLLLQSPAMGALSVLRAATDPQVSGGEYYGPRGFQQSKGHPEAVRSRPQSHDAELQRQLWARSEELTGVTFPV
ncbi:hypothetical protein OHN38_42230 [Streptomyces sp. NBC_00588]|nr:hypothetical protein OHN38_42230 [Streptomyces sp. NBC_00588]